MKVAWSFHIDEEYPSRIDRYKSKTYEVWKFKVLSIHFKVEERKLEVAGSWIPQDSHLIDLDLYLVGTSVI